MGNRKSRVCVPLAALLLAVAAIGAAPAARADTISTVADVRLQADVMQMIGMYESAAGGSAKPTLIAAEQLDREGASYVERWTVDSDGKQVAYRVKLTPSPSGGVDFSVTRLQ